MKYCSFKLNKWFWGKRENKLCKKDRKDLGFRKKIFDRFSIIINFELKIKCIVKKGLNFYLILLRW